MSDMRKHDTAHGHTPYVLTFTCSRATAVHCEQRRMLQALKGKHAQFPTLSLHIELELHGKAPSTIRFFTTWTSHLHNGHSHFDP